MKNNSAVASLKESVKNNPLMIQMSMYGGFEQVGALGIIKREYFFPQKGNTSITADVGKNIGFTKRATSSLLHISLA